MKEEEEPKTLKDQQAEGGRVSWGRGLTGLRSQCPDPHASRETSALYYSRPRCTCGLPSRLSLTLAALQ